MLRGVREQFGSDYNVPGHMAQINAGRTFGALVDFFFETHSEKPNVQNPNVGSSLYLEQTHGSDHLAINIRRVPESPFPKRIRAISTPRSELVEYRLDDQGIVRRQDTAPLQPGEAETRWRNLTPRDLSTMNETEYRIILEAMEAERKNVQQNRQFDMKFGFNNCPVRVAEVRALGDLLCTAFPLPDPSLR